MKEILGDLANATNIIVINDEAHHAWRVAAESKIKGVKKEDIEEKDGQGDIVGDIGLLAEFVAHVMSPRGKRSPRPWPP